MCFFWHLLIWLENSHEMNSEIFWMNMLHEDNRSTPGAAKVTKAESQESERRKMKPYVWARTNYQIGNLESDYPDHQELRWVWMDMGHFQNLNTFWILIKSYKIHPYAMANIAEKIVILCRKSQTCLDLPTFRRRKEAKTRRRLSAGYGSW